MSESGINLVKKWEGCKLKAYQCSAGVWTIGYGRTTNVKKGDVITKEQAELFLKEEYEEFENKVKKLLKVTLNDKQLGALTSLAYNIGLGNLSKSTLLRLVNSNKLKEASEQFMVWNKVRNPKTGQMEAIQGLTNRRTEEKNLFLS